MSVARAALFVICVLLCSPAVGAQEAARRKSVALVLSGGGARGYGHLPVLELIEELQIPVDMVVGVSAGAIVGGLYAAGYAPHSIRERLIALEWTPLFADKPVSPYRDELPIEDNSLGWHFGKRSALNLNAGISSGENVYKLFKSLTVKIPSYIDFDSLPVPFRAGTVRADTAEFVLLDSGDIAEAIRASMSIPALFSAFEIDGVRYVDGGVRNNLPIQAVRAMGYDIVIAVDLFNDIDSFRESTIEMINDFVALAFHSISKQQYADADLILRPDVRGFSIIDFMKSKEIYAQAVKGRDKLSKELSVIKEKIYDGAVPSTEAQDEYEKRPALVPQTLKIEGVLKSDRAHFEAVFRQNIAGKPLTERSINSFIQRLYATGNYNSIITRVGTQNESVVLEVKLAPRIEYDLLLQFAASYKGSFISDSFGMLTLNSDFFASNIFGANSVLGAGFEFNDRITAQIFYVQPFIYHLYVWMNARFMQETDVISTLLGEGNVNSPIGGDASVKFGFKGTPLFTSTAGAQMTLLSPDSRFARDVRGIAEKTGGDTMAASFFASIQANTLDSVVLPSKGLYWNSRGSLVLPFPDFTVNTFALAANQMCAALPLNSKLSIVAKSFIGAELSSAMRLNPVLAKHFAWNTLDRAFFPQSATKIRYGAYMGTLSLSLQYKPWNTLTIFGGQLFFSIAACAGTLFWNLEELQRNDAVLWNASVNAGLRLSSTFAARFRIGAGQTVSGGIAPFIAIDMGALRY